jgi:hypothetical protein
MDLMMRDMLTIFDANVYRAQFLFDMWDCVDRGDFEDAMKIRMRRWSVNRLIPISWSHL